MDKTNYSPDDECCPMDIDEAVLDSTFKIDNHCPWDISMQDVDLGNEDEAISSSSQQIENTHHNLPDIINTKNPFTNNTIPSNAFVGSVNQNFNLPQNNLLNGNFEVNSLSVINNSVSNGNIIQEVINTCEEVEMSCSNQMIDSLNACEDISGLKVFRDSIEADSLIVSADSVLNEAINISTDSLEIPCRVQKISDINNRSFKDVINIMPENVEQTQSNPISEVESLCNKLPTDLVKSEILSIDSDKIVVKSSENDSKNLTLSETESNSSTLVDSTEGTPKNISKESNPVNAFNTITMIPESEKISVHSNNNELGNLNITGVIESDEVSKPDILNTTAVIESTENNPTNVVTDKESAKTDSNQMPNVLNSTVVVESVKNDSEIIKSASNEMCNILNSEILVVDSTESIPKNITVVEESINTDFNEKPTIITESTEVPNVLNSQTLVVDSAIVKESTNTNFNERPTIIIKSTNPINSISPSKESIEKDSISSTSEIDSVNSSNILNSTSEIIESSNIMEKKSNTQDISSEIQLNNTDILNNTFELKDLNPAISNISVTETKSSECDVINQVINSLDACSIPETTNHEKLESCKIPDDNKINSSQEIENTKSTLESCNILDSELNTELTIVSSGVTIATPKTLIIDNSSEKPDTSILVDANNTLLNENCISSSSNVVDENSKLEVASEASDKSPVLSKTSLFTNISRAANIIIESPKKLAEIINKKSPNKNVVSESTAHSISSEKHVDSEQIKSDPQPCDKSNISIDSPVKLVDIFNQNVSNVENSNISESVASNSVVPNSSIVESKLLKEASENSVSASNIDHINEVSIDKMKLVEMESVKKLEQINEVSSSNENRSKLDPSSSKLPNPTEISGETQQLSINTLNFAGSIDGSKSIVFETNTPVLPKTSELQNTAQPVSKAPVGKTIPLNLDQLSGRISLDSPKIVAKPEPAKRSSTSEYAVAPDFGLKEQEAAMKRGSLTESDLVDSVEKFSVHDDSVGSKSLSSTLTEKSDFVLNKSVARDILNTTGTIVSQNINNTTTVLNSTTSENLDSTFNLNSSNTVGENILNTTNTIIVEDLNKTNCLESNVMEATNTVIPENTTENLLNITGIVTHDNLSCVDNEITTPNIVNIEDMLNTTNTIITNNVIATNEGTKNNLELINTIPKVDCLNKTPVSNILDTTNTIIANEECLNITNNTNAAAAKILDITNTEIANNSDTGINVAKNASGSSFSELNASAENTFNSTVILCNEKLNSTQVLLSQPNVLKKQNGDCFVAGLVDEIVKNSVDNSEIKTSPTVKLQELQFDKSFDEKTGLNKSLIRKKRNSPQKLLLNDEESVKFDGATSPKKVDLPQIHKVISPVSNIKSSEILKKIQSPKLKDSEEKGNTLCSPKITLKSVCRKSDNFVASNMEKPLCSEEPLDDTVELGSTTLIMSSTKVCDDSFNAVCANNNPEDQNGLVCDSLKSPKTVLVKDNQGVSVEDRSPFKKINSNWKDSKVKKAEETIMPDVVIKAEEVNEAKISYENKENFSLSIFSNSPAKPKPTNRRDTLFRLFDPLYDSLSQDTTVSSNSPQSLEKHETISNKVSSSLICINEGPNAADIALISCNKIKEDLSDERDIETFLEALPETLHSFKAKMDDAIDERMKMEQELNELKLELNQLQQERTSLQLELHQKEEVILKIQGEAQKLGNQYKQEIKQLQDKLNTINEQNNNEEVKILREEISKLKDRDAQLNEKNSKLVDQIAALENTVHNYETTLDRVIKESEKLRVEHDNTKKHLATLEVSFSDVHAKYERTKEFVVAYKNNEEVLSDKLEKSEEVARRYEERYETLKAHAKAQIDKANKELSTMKEKHQIELNKMTALLRRLEIKTGSIQQALDQKTKECAALAALCDEMAGSVPQ